ncbi:MAG: hypothetical protein JNK76_22110 [Planctomycetales bacterium]|nr:hypothetical protein [Planctomycetales bacterium]
MNRTLICRTLLLLMLAAYATEALAQFPANAQRGRYRRGPFGGERLRFGAGFSPAGVQVATGFFGVLTDPNVNATVSNVVGSVTGRPNPQSVNARGGSAETDTRLTTIGNTNTAIENFNDTLQARIDKLLAERINPELKAANEKPIGLVGKLKRAAPPAAGGTASVNAASVGASAAQAPSPTPVAPAAPASPAAPAPNAQPPAPMPL